MLQGFFIPLIIWGGTYLAQRNYFSRFSRYKWDNYPDTRILMKDDVVKRIRELENREAIHRLLGEGDEDYAYRYSNSANNGVEKVTYVLYRNSYFMAGTDFVLILSFDGRGNLWKIRYSAIPLSK